MITDNDFDVNWWLRDEENISFIREHHHNGKYLRAAILNTDLIQLNSDVNQVIEKSNILILAIPSAFLADALSKVDSAEMQKKHLVSAIKGMEPGSHLIISDYLQGAASKPDPSP